MITEKMACSARTVRHAVQWCLKNAVNFTSAEHLKIQIDKVQELKLQIQQRLRRVQEGSSEKTTKKHYGQEVETVERQRFNFNAEASLLRLLKDLTAEENTLFVVYDTCVEEENITRTVEDLRKLLG